VDGSFPDAYGTPFNPPTPPTPDYSGVDAVCAAYGPLGVKMLVVVYPVAPDTTSWSTAAGGSKSKALLTWADPSNMTMMDQLCTSMQAVIDRWRTKWVEYGGSLEDLEFQFGNEEALGGSGSLPSTASNAGHYDIWSDAAGTVSSAGYLRTQAVAVHGEGHVLTDANIDSLATSLSRADLADARGVNETNSYILSQVNFYDHLLIGPAMEHQISGGWGGLSAPNALIGSSTVPARERASRFPDSFNFDDYYDKSSINVYIGSHSSVGSTTPALYAQWMKQAIVRMCTRYRQEVPAFARKGMWITECGLSTNWVPDGTVSDLRGSYWKALLNMFPLLPDIERVYLYRGHNYSSGEDALSSSTNFGIFASTGAASPGASETVVSSSATTS